MVKVVLKVSGMSCEHCVKAVTNALYSLPGIDGVSVDLGAGEVSLEHDPAQITLNAIKAGIMDQGYGVKD